MLGRVSAPHYGWRSWFLHACFVSLGNHAAGPARDRTVPSFSHTANISDCPSCTQNCEVSPWPQRKVKCIDDLRGCLVPIGTEQTVLIGSVRIHRDRRSKDVGSQRDSDSSIKKAVEGVLCPLRAQTSPAPPQAPKHRGEQLPGRAEGLGPAECNTWSRFCISPSEAVRTNYVKPQKTAFTSADEPSPESLRWVWGAVWWSLPGFQWLWTNLGIP